MRRRSIAERTHRIVRWTPYDRGGHFASLQAPDLLVADLVAACEEQGIGSCRRTISTDVSGRYS